MMSRPIVLETKRLIFKAIDFSDLENLYALRSDPDVMKYGVTQSKKEVADFIHCGQGYYEKYGLDFFSVFEKETSTFVGQAGLFHVYFDAHQPDIELAYRFHKAYWGKGYATEAAKALITHGFNKLSLSKIIAYVHLENEASKKVLEKIGMVCCGIVRRKDFPETLFYCYQIVNPHKLMKR